ncbi:MAG: sulfotransferase [Chromatiales bacterium]|nr:sulfotransferase [Chromatiales bacterium]
MSACLESAHSLSATKEKIIFVTGASRSGTTLLSFVLRNHEQILGLAELQYFGDFFDPRVDAINVSERQLLKAIAAVFLRHEAGMRKGRLEACDRNMEMVCAERAKKLLSKLPKSEHTPCAVFAAAIEELTDEAGKSIPCEQTPRNIFYAEALLEHYPEAHVVHMMRDPRAVMASQKKRWKRRKLLANRAALPGRDALRAWVNYHPYTMATLWDRATGEAMRLRSHPRFHIVRFEDLLERPEPTIRNLCKELGIDFQAQMLNIQQINSSHESSARGARSGFNPQAVHAWKQTLHPGEISVTERMCRKKMQLNGYSPIATGPALMGELRCAGSYIFHATAVLAVNPMRAWIQLRALLGGKSKRI